MTTESPTKFTATFKRKLYPKQRAAIFNDARYAIVEASTKSGKTHACIEWLFTEMSKHGRAGRNFWWVAPTYNQSKIAYNRLIRSVPKSVITKANQFELSVTFKNGAIIRHLSRPKNLMDYMEKIATVQSWMKCTRMREEAWYAIRSTLTATHGRARINWERQRQKRIGHIESQGEPKLVNLIGIMQD